MFWERFYSLCQGIGKKPNPVGKEIGVSSGAITKWKNGTIPPADTLLSIAEYFHVSLDYLLGNDVSTSRSETLPDILYRFPELSDDRKKEVLAFVEFKLAQQQDDQKPKK